jgi:hypothetical protein
MNAPAFATPLLSHVCIAALITSVAGCHEGDERYAPDVFLATDLGVGVSTVPPEADVPPPDLEEPDVAFIVDMEPDVAPDIVLPWTPAVYVYPVCDATSPSGLTGCVDMARLTDTLTSIVGSRYPGDAKWAEVRGMCNTAMLGSGFTVTENPGPISGGGNVIGVKLGTDPALQGERIIVGAHIDGRRNCDAANGNGTGVAALFELIGLLGPRGGVLGRRRAATRRRHRDGRRRHGRRR